MIRQPAKKVRTDYLQADNTRTHADLYDLETGEVTIRTFYRANGTEYRTEFYRANGTKYRTEFYRRTADVYTEYYDLDGETLIKSKVRKQTPAIEQHRDVIGRSKPLTTTTNGRASQYARAAEAWT